MVSFPTIPSAEMHISFVASPGPGGQNVNKTATKAQLRWHLMSSSVFSDSDKHLLASKLADRLTQDGCVVVDVSETRSQAQNKHLAIERLHNLVQQALTPAIPRRATRVPRRTKLERLANKRQRSDIKQSRKYVAED